MRTRSLTAAVIAVAFMVPTATWARKKVPSAQVEGWTACAVEKNAGDVAWMYMLSSDQSELKGPALDGANAMAVFLMARGCAPASTTFDNDMIVALTKRSVTLWNGDTKKLSTSRSIDEWADCMVADQPGRSRAYLFARDFAFAGPRLVVEGVDPIENFFTPVTKCDGIKPNSDSEIDKLDLYARLNYRLRVEPRLQTAVVAKEAN